MENFLKKYVFYILPMRGILIKIDMNLKYVHMFQVNEASEKGRRYHPNFIVRHRPKEVRITCHL